MGDDNGLVYTAWLLFALFCIFKWIAGQMDLHDVEKARCAAADLSRRKKRGNRWVVAVVVACMWFWIRWYHRSGSIAAEALQHFDVLLGAIEDGDAERVKRIMSMYEDGVRPWKSASPPESDDRDYLYKSF